MAGKICSTCNGLGMVVRPGRGIDACPECAARAEAEWQAARRDDAEPPQIGGLAWAKRVEPHFQEAVSDAICDGKNTLTEPLHDGYFSHHHGTEV